VAAVESRCGAERIRFRTPLIEPDGRFSRIRLSDKEYDLSRITLFDACLAFTHVMNCLLAEFA
jgi:hypothetical protein